MNNAVEAPFTFSWLALKLLGRGLYSNPWNALSELVANGLDAGADNVYIYLDATDKSAATLEIIDDGAGMNMNDINNYVKVGFNKREYAKANGSVGDNQIKGRKGIGKLAALFLSRHFFLRTRHEEGQSSWELDAREGNVKDDDTPSLTATDRPPITANEELWESLRTGTRLTLHGVDLTGYGPQAINALGSRLANQFLLDSSNAKRILLSVNSHGKTYEPEYKSVTKNIAFGNLAEVAQYYPDDSVTQPPELTVEPPFVTVPAKGLPNDGYQYQQVRTSFPIDPPEDEAWSEIAHLVDKSNRTYMGVRYRLTGWIGVHSTIKNDLAKLNDERFTKNRYYNPAQLRVYVRGKLANDSLLNQLGITGTYANYIEGEISFDLLDDDSLPDIATSNRQAFDETDGRVTLLRALVRPIVRSLMQRRSALASLIAKETENEQSRRSETAKRHFSNQVQRDLDDHPEIDQMTRDDLHMVITNKVQGDFPLKQQYKVFISHARADKPFAAFIDEVLRYKGAKDSEVFFTSRTGSTEQSLDVRSLSTVIKENITDANTLVFYMTSQNFLRSQYCLFEGGAGWATRAVSEYLKLNMDYESIPGFLTNGRAEVTLIGGDGKIVLSPELHNYLIKGVFNPMISHINRGREIAGESCLELFEPSVFPSTLELQQNGSKLEDYFDRIITDHWAALIATEADKYVVEYFGTESDQ